MSSLDPRLVGFTIAAGAVSALIAGLLPALRASRVNVLEVVQRGGSGSVGRVRGAGWLIATEAALGIFLVAGASVSIRSFVGLVRTRPGFASADLYRLTVMAGSTHRPINEDAAGRARQRAAKASRVLEFVRAAPGVVAAGAVSQFPIGDVWTGDAFWNERGVTGGVWGLTTGALDALATPLEAGRLLTDAEVASVALVALVNEAGARVLWPGVAVTDVPGRFLDAKDGRRRVVGVVADIRPRPGQAGLPGLYLPISAAEVPPWSAAVIVALRMTPGRALDVASLQSLLEPQFGRNMVRVSLSEVAREITPWLQQPRFQAALFGSLAVIALLLTAIGVYAIASFDVTRRRAEIGVRMTLGASTRDIRCLVVGDTLRPVVAGLVAGTCVTWWARQFVQAFLFEVNARDPLTLTLVAGLLTGAALVAGWLPARRASRVDPAAALKAN